MEDETHKQRGDKPLWEWALFVAGMMFSGVLAWKLLTAQFVVDLSTFNFGDLLSIVLALFSISLSAAFYFKATETSHAFYNNTYKFTKEISEILGRIEAGFGERLRHLDEGYSGLVDRVGREPSSSQNLVQEAKLEIDVERKKLQAEMVARNEILDELMKRAHLRDDERKSILSQLTQKDKEIAGMHRELSLMRAELKHAQQRSRNARRALPPLMRRFLSRAVTELGSEVVQHAPHSVVNRRFARLLSDMAPTMVPDLQMYGILDTSGNLTERGFLTLHALSSDLDRA